MVEGVYSPQISLKWELVKFSSFAAAGVEVSLTLYMGRMWVKIGTLCNSIGPV